MEYFKVKGFPTTGENPKVCPGTEWEEEEEEEEEGGRTAANFPLIFASAGVSSVGEWGQEL